MIDAARRAAEDTLLDQTFLRVDEQTYQHFLNVLDVPPHNEGFKRLMNARKPWLLRCTFYNPYTARLSESEKNVHLSYVASGDRR